MTYGHLINLGSLNWWTNIYRRRDAASKQWPGHDISRATLTLDKPKRRKT